MAFIEIHTNNQSRTLRNTTTFVDNWVYVPGTAITGDPTKVYAFTTLDDFKNACGTRGPEGSKTFEYVSGLLSAGLPVLFRRIAYIDQDSGGMSPANIGQDGNVVKAKATYTHTDPDTSATVIDFTVEEKYGGTFGNDMEVQIRESANAYWIDVYVLQTLLERVRLCTFPVGSSQEVKNDLLITALKTTEFDRIKVNVNIDDPKKFVLSGDGVKQPLSGGKDFNENNISHPIETEIANSYKFIKDKILYQPKFLTSGGYVDSKETLQDSTLRTTSIAEKMKEITLERQDCRALIDLPLGTDVNDQQDLAECVCYTQLSDTQLIPSASVCAPWVYTQLGSTQEWMPPSFAFLTVMGNSISKGSPSYTPKAGIATGQVANIIRPEFEIGSDVYEKWQADDRVNINPIMRLQGGNYVINGNSTLLKPDDITGTNNVFCESSGDLTVIEIRRFVYNLATELQYQYNGVVAFETFSIRTAKFMERLSSEGAITDYEIINASSDAEPRKLKVILNVFITPTIKQIEIFLNIQYGSIEISTGGVS